MRAGGGGAAAVTRRSGGGGAGAGGRAGALSARSLCAAAPGAPAAAAEALRPGEEVPDSRRGVRATRGSGAAAEAAGEGGGRGRERGAAPLGRPGGAAAATSPLGALLPANSIRSRKLSALLSVAPAGSRHGSRPRRGGRGKGVRGVTSRTSPEKDLGRPAPGAAAPAVPAAAGELWAPIAGRRERPGCAGGSSAAAAAAAAARQPRR